VDFAVFIEPKGKLREDILDWKKKISEFLPDQPYCSHPPHCTLLHTKVRNKDKALTKMDQIVTNIAPFKLKVHDVGIFWKDFATGGHTLFLRISTNKKLYNLQLKIAKAFTGLIDSTNFPQFVKNNTILKKSFKNYGFPFVGSHWIPHLTIASLRLEKSHSIISEFQSWQPKYTLNVDELSCWNVSDEKHTLIKKYKLI